MKLSTYAKNVLSLVQEYAALFDTFDTAPTDEEVRKHLISYSEWSERGAATILHLAKEYGTFGLSHALALAEALHIEDGDAGI